MEITYRLRYRDLLPTWSAYRRLYRAEPVICVFLILHQLVCIGVALFMMGLFSWAARGMNLYVFEQLIRHIGLPGLVVTVLVCPILLVMHRQMKRQIISRVVSEKVFQKGAWRTISLTWDEVTAVVHENDGLCFYGRPAKRKNIFAMELRPYELSSVIHIPYHAFESEHQRDEFYAMAQGFWEMAQRGVFSKETYVWPPAPRVGV
jgi:hypothetical protein